MTCIRCGGGPNFRFSPMTGFPPFARSKLSLRTWLMIAYMDAAEPQARAEALAAILNCSSIAVRSMRRRMKHALPPHLSQEIVAATLEVPAIGQGTTPEPLSLPPETERLVVIQIGEDSGMSCYWCNERDATIELKIFAKPRLIGAKLEPDELDIIFERELCDECKKAPISEAKRLGIKCLEFTGNMTLVEN
jgi:hypothetical protein